MTIERWVPGREVDQIFGWHKRTRQRKVRAGEIRKPVIIGNRACYPESYVKELQQRYLAQWEAAATP